MTPRTPMRPDTRYVIAWWNGITYVDGIREYASIPAALHTIPSDIHVRVVEVSPRGRRVVRYVNVPPDGVRRGPANRRRTDVVAV